MIIRVRYFLFVLGVLGFLIEAYAGENEDVFENQTIAVSPSSELLAINWLDSIAIFNLEDGRRLHQFDAGTEDPFAFKFSFDGSKLLSSGWEKVSIWDTETGKLLAQKDVNDNAKCAGFSSDAQISYFDDEYNQFGHKQLVVTGNNFADEKLLVKDTGNCHESADNSLLAIESYTMAADGFSLDDTAILIVDLEKAQKKMLLRTEKAKPYDEDMFFFDENRKLLVRDFSTFHIWDLEKNIVIRSWDSEMDVEEIAVSGNQLLITADKQKRSWNLLAEPGPIQNIALPDNQHSVLSVSLSNNGKWYAVTSYDDSEQNAWVSLFDSDTNELLRQIATEPLIYGAQFTGDDTLLVFESYPVKVVDVATGKVVFEIKQ